MRQAPGALTEMAGNKAIVIDADNRELITLNAVGSVVWQLLEQERSAQELVDLLLERFPDAPPDQVEEDVAAFLDELRSAGLLSDDAAR